MLFVKHFFSISLCFSLVSFQLIPKLLELPCFTNAMVGNEKGSEKQADRIKTIKEIWNSGCKEFARDTSKVSRKILHETSGNEANPSRRRRKHFSNTNNVYESWDITNFLARTQTHTHNRPGKYFYDMITKFGTLFAFPTFSSYSQRNMKVC